MFQAAIIGQITGEILFIGVRNKYCSICTRAEAKEIEANNHTCYKNWTGSASSMEANILVEGFNRSIEMHGVQYRKFIGDGDSSTFARLKDEVSYGNQIRKVECTNHAIKNFHKHLIKVKKDTNITLRGRKLLTQHAINHLVRRAKCIIAEQSKTGNVDILRRDLCNMINHVFGNHIHCREGTCNVIGDTKNNKIPMLKETSIFHHINGRNTELNSLRLNN